MSRDAFTKVAAQIEKDGYDKGYKQALKDIRKDFLAALDRLANPEASLPSPAANGKGPPKETRGPRASSDQARVFEAIQMRPGMRGVDIVSRLAFIDPERPVNERTVRTALNRLKGRERIHQIDGRWYPGKQPTLLGGPQTTIGQH